MSIEDTREQLASCADSSILKKFSRKNNLLVQLKLALSGLLIVAFFAVRRETRACIHILFLILWLRFVLLFEA